MDAKRLDEWVTALQAIHTAAGLTGMPDERLRRWTRHTPAAITSSTLAANNLHEITETFLAYRRNTKFASSTELLTYQKDSTESSLAQAKNDTYSVLRWLEQTANLYPVIGAADKLSAASLTDPYSSPCTYLQHPAIDVLDQETITKIATRDTGA